MARWFRWLALGMVGMTFILLGVSSSGATQGKPSRPSDARSVSAPSPTFASSVAALERELGAALGKEQKARLHRGLTQVASFWRPEDGDEAMFESFVREHFAKDQATRDVLFDRFQRVFEQLDGHLLEINREARRQIDLDLGPLLPVDHILAAYDPGAHVNDDLFANKLAFAVLLNFPLTSLEERLAEGEKWSRREWAEARLAERFSRRVPAAVSQRLNEAFATGDAYISGYNIWMHHLLDERGQRPFPPKLRLISHWNLRDELKANYSEPGGITKQRLIQKVMERIVTQSIPAVVVDNPQADWNPFANTVTPAAVDDGPGEKLRAPVSSDPEPNTRYAKLLAIFQAMRGVDAHSPTAPTLIARRFDEERQLPESRVRAMFEAILGAPEAIEIGRLIATRLGRPLEPFDIWYNGLRPREAHSESELDALLRARFPNAAAFEKEMPTLLRGLGFTPARAEYLSRNIVVDPSRGAGHAMGAQRKGDLSHLRTRIEPDGMNYKGYNIAIHELGHNVEQTFSLNDIDSWFLRGIPNTAFTEAMAFVFQARDLQLLGFAPPPPGSEAMTTLQNFWETFEICGVALVDMDLWRWMYEHPEATPAELRDATVAISAGVWNRYFAPVFGMRDVSLLGIYSHMIDGAMYLPDYPLGRMIAYQIAEKIRVSGDLGGEFERMARIGNIAPDLWMKEATGRPVGPEALLEGTRAALSSDLQIERRIDR